ncbi:MAG: hypothetical protein H3C42_01925 [Phycisphaerae bacterium]|nr:hypothetical protein [Phycisphaerae bacterium]
MRKMLTMSRRSAPIRAATVRERLRRTACIRRLSRVLLGVVMAAGGAAHGQDVPDEPSGAGLVERQNTVRERLQRLEGLMLNLARALEATEPEKAERLRDTLDQVGQRRVKARAERLVALLREGKLSDASRDQEALLGDLGALLDLLTSQETELDKRRAERERLEAHKRAIRALLDEQAERLMRTQRASPDDEGALPALEAPQRETQRKTDELQREMEGRPFEGGQPPGAPQARRAADHMRQAADRLGEARRQDAEAEQQRAMEQLQRALDELEDALRQVRREEMEQTLAALEARFRAMREREKQVRATVASLAGGPREGRSRMDQMRLAEAVDTQRQVSQDCAAVHRILVDEGTTVILPELVTQLADDVDAIAALLDQGETSPRGVQMLDDVITLLDEILGAIETRTAENQEAPAQERPRAGGDDAQPLLPGSAELKLLRGSQVRINERTAALAAGSAGADGGVEHERLSMRQRRLAELTQRMHERK